MEHIEVMAELFDNRNALCPCLSRSVPAGPHEHISSSLVWVTLDVPPPLGEYLELFRPHPTERVSSGCALGELINLPDPFVREHKSN